MPRNLAILIISGFAYGIWLGYLGWMVSCRRPEPILEELGQDFWPSRPWIAASEALVEVKPAGAGHEVVRVYKSAPGSPGVGEVLAKEVSLGLLKRVGNERESQEIAIHCGNGQTYTRQGQRTLVNAIAQELLRQPHRQFTAFTIRQIASCNHVTNIVHVPHYKVSTQWSLESQRGFEIDLASNLPIA